MSTKAKRKTKPKGTTAKRAKPRVTRKRAPPTKPPEAKTVEIPRPQEAPAVPVLKNYVFAVRLSGTFGVPVELESTMRVLKIDRKFRGVLLEKNQSTIGMLRQVKDYITWGEMLGPDISSLLQERAEVAGGLRLTDQYVKETFGEESVGTLAQALLQGKLELRTLWEHGVKPVFRLHAPSGGFQYSSKRPFGSKGELGYRGKEIRSLVTRMY